MIKVALLLLVFVGFTTYMVFGHFKALESDGFLDFLFSMGGLYLAAQIAALVIYIKWMLFIKSYPKKEELSDSNE